MSGTQLIGWDPRIRQIRSWVFDSDGGFSEALWSQRRRALGDQVQRACVKDGRTVASATNHPHPRRSATRFRWVSVDRTLGPEVLPDAEEITLVRKPPQPRPARTTQKPVQPGSPQ